MSDSGGGISSGVPTAARVYDVMLGGKDNFAVDRAVAEASLAIMPELRDIARYNREMLHRVVRYLAAEEGIDQFLDLGSGLPTVRNTHEVVHAVNPEAHVVYVDIDPIVLAYGRAFLADNDKTIVVTADIRDHQELINHPDVRAHIDFTRPVCVMLCGILHHLNDDEHPGRLVKALRAAVPSGSFFFITNFTRLSDSPESVELENQLLDQLGSGRVRTPAELAEFFTGLDILLPGLVPLPLWRPDTPVLDPTPLGVRFMTGGVGRKP